MQLFAAGGFALGAIGRGDALVPDFFAARIEPRFALGSRISIAPYLGYSLPLSHSEFYTVPLGVNLLVVADRAFDVGATFEFTDIASRTITEPGGTLDTGGFSERSVRVFATLRL